MTTSNGTVGDQVEAFVESVNERGVRVGGDWRNVSKFHPVDLPDRGARGRLELDNKGFIRTLQVLEAAPLTSSPRRDRTITRLSVLKTAAAFLGARCPQSQGQRPTDPATWDYDLSILT